MSSKAYKHFMNARCRLMTKEPFYGHMCMRIEWKESNRYDTLGIAVLGTGSIIGYFNPKWVLTVDIERLFGYIEHTINHLIRLHALRSNSRNKQAWNIACDMAVNGHKNSPFIGYKKVVDVTKTVIILPDDDMIFTPDRWDAGKSAEYYYQKLLDENGNGNNDNDNDWEDDDPNSHGGIGVEGGEGESGEGEDNDSERYSYGGTSGSSVDSHDSWSESTAGYETARRAVNDAAVDSAQKSRGNVPGNLTEVLAELNKPIVVWSDILKRFLGKHVGGSRKTHSRANRRYNAFGVKGVSHRAAATVNIIVDTSGSISNEELKQFFGEIENISYRAKVHILQWDAAFVSYDSYRKGDWKKFKIGGRGGTDMAAPVDWLDENSPIANLTIMLTDGYCNWPDKRDYPMVFVITSDKVEKPDWGNSIFMDVHQ